MTQDCTSAAAGLTAVALEQALTSARSEADRLGAKVCIAVVDAGGAPAAFLRMPGTFLVSTELATDKAWSAASFGMSTLELRAMLKGSDSDLREGLLRRPRVTDIAGGIPVSGSGGLLGAVGVSGGSEEEDEQVAHAAARQLEALLRAPGR